MSCSSLDNLGSLVQPDTFIIEANRALAAMIPAASPIPAGTPIRNAVGLFSIRMDVWAEWQVAHGPSYTPLKDSGVIGPVTAIDPDAPPACVVERLRRDLGN